MSTTNYEAFHPYARYGLALTMQVSELKKADEVQHAHLTRMLETGLNHFRMAAEEFPQDMDQVKYRYLSQEEVAGRYQTKGNPGTGVFLTPNVITDDKSAGNFWKGIQSLLTEIKGSEPLESNTPLTMSLSAISAKINNGKKSQSPPSVSLLEACCAAISNIHPLKPCITARRKEKKGIKRSNTCLIPDLPLAQLMSFIKVFGKLSSDAALLNGRIRIPVGKDPTLREYQRPRIENGNFPDAPISNLMGPLALLGAIGRLAREIEEYRAASLEVLESLENATMYQISMGNADVFVYSHWAIELAKQNNLGQIIYGLERSRLYEELENGGNIDYNAPKRQQYLMFASRLLLLFSEPAFRDFMAQRAEYHPDTYPLFNTYFMEQYHYSPQVIAGAKAMGRWLNQGIYHATKTSDNPQKAKAKGMVEFESSIMGAKSPAEMLQQVQIRAGRLFEEYTEAPAAALPFIEAVLSGEISDLRQAQSLLIIFMRLRSERKASDSVAEEEVQVSEDDDMTD